MITLPHAQLTNTSPTDAVRRHCAWHWRWKCSIWKACLKCSPAWAHHLHSSSVRLHLLNREMSEAPDHCKCFTHQWERKEARGQKQYKVKAIHTSESLPRPSHCYTVLGSQMTTRGVVVNTNYLKVQEGRVKYPELFMALCNSCHLHLLWTWWVPPLKNLAKVSS